MNRILGTARWVCWALALGCVPAESVAGETLVARQEPTRLVVSRGAIVVGEYDFSGAAVPRPFWSNLRLPDGRLVTRHHPPREGQDDLDHGQGDGYFHPGVWHAFTSLNGHDYWRRKAVIRQEEFVDDPETTGDLVAFTARSSYRDPQAAERSVAEELCRFTLRSEGDGLALVCDFVLRPVDEPLVFGDEEEMGMGVRLTRSMAVIHGGVIVDSLGRKNPPAIWGQRAAWCDCRGPIDGGWVGMLFLADSANPLETRWHARDYGFVAANPFADQVFSQGPARQTVVGIGEALRLRYVLCWRPLEQSDADARPLAEKLTGWLAELPRPKFAPVKKSGP